MTPKEIQQARVRLKIESLEPQERDALMLLMDGFKNIAQHSIVGGEELLRMCDGCAFRKGTDANEDPMTNLTAIECVLKEESFYCHKRFCPNGDEKLCNGWINVMNNK